MVSTASGMESPSLEDDILAKLRCMGLKVTLGGRRYSGNDEYHNWYVVGLGGDVVFGELEFSVNPVWRVVWYSEGMFMHDSGFILSNFNTFIRHIEKDCIPGLKSKKMDDSLKDIEEDFK